jgi:hypothetical protein
MHVPLIPEPSTVNNKLKRREGSGSTGRFFDFFFFYINIFNNSVCPKSARAHRGDSHPNIYDLQIYMR